MRSSVCTVELISIHALREEGDTLPRLLPEMGFNFYPRPPRGGRPHMTSYVNVFQRFLSTPSARRATFWRQKTPGVPFISIHALREEGDLAFFIGNFVFWNFYPRPPRGGRHQHPCWLLRSGNFYPRPPRGGRQLQEYVVPGRSDFYPRPPRGGRPKHREGVAITWMYFYPRPPRGGRRYIQVVVVGTGIFLSTPSARRATGIGHHFRQEEGISIHALREEGDFARRIHRPCSQTISIHALREEGDSKNRDKISIFL